MGVVYRYIDLNDNRIKYVGIVWSGNRTLKQRIEEHYKNDNWCDKGHWRIEYVLREINTRTDAEYLEAHYTNKFRNPEYEWFGKTKLNWGESELIDDTKDEWKIYSTDEEEQSSFKTRASIDAIQLLRRDLECAIKFRIKEFDFACSIKGFTTLIADGNTDCIIPGDMLLENILKQGEDTEQFIVEDGDLWEELEEMLKGFILDIDVITSEIDGSITDIYFIQKYHFKVNEDHLLEFVVDDDSIKQFIVDNEIPIYKKIN